MKAPKEMVVDHVPVDHKRTKASLALHMCRLSVYAEKQNTSSNAEACSLIHQMQIVWRCIVHMYNKSYVLSRHAIRRNKRYKNNNRIGNIQGGVVIKKNPRKEERTE